MPLAIIIEYSLSIMAYSCGTLIYRVIKIETAFPLMTEKSDANDANDSKLILLEPEGQHENKEPTLEQTEISEAQRVKTHVTAKSVSKSQFLRQHFEAENKPYAESTNAMIEKCESA